MNDAIMSSAGLLDDDVVTEILLRLPPESVLRSRAVSKHWRRLATCPTFVAAYSLRRPLELLAYPDGYNLRLGAQNVLTAVNPLSSGHAPGWRRFLRLHSRLHLVDSRDGLLLFVLEKRSFVICNPATRQWVSLPCLAPEPRFCTLAFGLYFHRPSGEYRVLCTAYLPPPGFTYHPPSGRYRSDADCDAVPDGASAFHYILSAGAAEPRHLRPVVGDNGIMPSACLALGDTLHWSHHPESGGTGKMVAFDTVTETFRLISPPPSIGRDHNIRQLDMDGTLAVSALAKGSRCMDVWALEDHDGERWSCRLRIDLPPPRLPRQQRIQWQPDDEAVAVVEGGVLLVVGSGWVVLYDTKEKRTLSKVDHSRDIGNVTLCLYRVSLVPLPEPNAQPFPFCRPGGDEPLLRHCPADDPCMSLRRSDCGTWIVPTVI